MSAEVFVPAPPPLEFLPFSHMSMPLENVGTERNSLVEWILHLAAKVIEASEL